MRINVDRYFYHSKFIVVSVSPTIIDQETSSDMVVLESTNVSLTCKATGYPEPYVMWRREDGEVIRYNGQDGNEVIFSNFIGGTPNKSALLPEIHRYTGICVYELSLSQRFISAY